MNGIEVFSGTRWPLEPVGSLCQPKQTVNPRKAPDTPIRYIDISSVCKATFRITGHTDYLGADAPSRARNAVAEGDVIFATTRPYLRNVAQVPKAYDGAVCSTGFCVLRANERALPDWLYYLCLSDGLMRQVTPKMRGANYPAVANSDVFAAEVPVPPLDEQQRIVGQIREAMDRVEELRILREGAVTASLALLPSLLKEVFDGVGGHGYSVSPLGKLIENTKYGTSQKCFLEADGLPILRIPNIEVGDIGLGKMKYLPWKDADVDKLTLNRGDILLVRTNGSPNLVGRCAVFDLEGTYGYASYLIRVRPNLELAIPKYLAYYLASTAGRDQIAARRRTSAGQFNINSSNLKTIELPVPPLARQHGLVNQMDEIRTSAISTLRQQLESQESEAALPGAILRKAFAGEL